MLLYSNGLQWHIQEFIPSLGAVMCYCYDTKECKLFDYERLNHVQSEN